MLCNLCVCVAASDSHSLERLRSQPQRQLPGEGGTNPRLSVCMGGSVSDRQTHTNTDAHWPSHLLPPLLAAHKQTHLAILDSLCVECVTRCLDFVRVCVHYLVTLKQLAPAARTHRVNTASIFKHTSTPSYQTPLLALAYQHKQTHSYWSV